MYFKLNMQMTTKKTNLPRFQFQSLTSDPVAAEKLELRKMRTLERRTKMSELQRFRKAQVSSAPNAPPGPGRSFSNDRFCE